MSGQNAKGKSKYESPILVPLGEMARGSGACEAGSSVVAGTACAEGAADAGTIDCTAGPTAVRDCTAGTAATRDCSQGVSATNACSAGESALPACTNGTIATGACTGGGAEAVG